MKRLNQNMVKNVEKDFFFRRNVLNNTLLDFSRFRKFRDYKINMTLRMKFVEG